MKGIILAGGLGTRLYPMTKSVSKQILPVYDKPMIYYPLSILMLSGIKEILIISTPNHLSLYKTLLGTGEELGLSFKYSIQDKPRGLADAFIVGEDFIAGNKVSLILGDNILYGQSLTTILQRASKLASGAMIFGHYVQNPSSYGVVEIDPQTKKVISIEEKPSIPKSNYAIPGLYYYDEKVVKLAKEVTPSKGGEIEITDLNRKYLELGELNVELFGRGLAWFDTGTPERLLEASSFIAAIQKRQGLNIACLEEIAYNLGYIDDTQLEKHAIKQRNSDYGKYLMTLLEKK